MCFVLLTFFAHAGFNLSLGHVLFKSQQEVIVCCNLFDFINGQLILATRQSSLVTLAHATRTDLAVLTSSLRSLRHRLRHPCVARVSLRGAKNSQ